MRSQLEILEKIDGIAKILYKPSPKKDPFYQQYKILVHKLDWKNAREFMKPEDRTEEGKTEWEKLNILDKKVLIAEIKEQCDLGAMHVCGNDVEYAFFTATGLMAQFWLLGPHYDKILTALWQDYMNPENTARCCEKTFEDVCNELGLNWKRMKLCYTTGMFSRLTDQYGKNLRLQQDADIAQAIEETVEEKAQGKLAIEKDKEDRENK